jgi:hypothetical protein
MMMRKLITAGTAAILTLTLVASPAVAKKQRGGLDPAQFAYIATIDCFGKPMTVGSGEELYSPMYELKTGLKLQPIAWNVTFPGGGSMVDSSGVKTKLKRVCAYDDGYATGTVTVTFAKRD